MSRIEAIFLDSSRFYLLPTNNVGASAGVCTHINSETTFLLLPEVRHHVYLRACESFALLLTQSVVLLGGSDLRDALLQSSVALISMRCSMMAFGFALGNGVLGL